jgi:hypothetical protein
MTKTAASTRTAAPLPDEENGYGPDDGGDSPECACCATLGALAYAASSCCQQADCAAGVGDQAGCDCCKEALEHIANAMDACVKCLRGACPTLGSRKMAAGGGGEQQQQQQQPQKQGKKS